jgi:hypothetical protein
MPAPFTPSPDVDALRLRINTHPVYAAVNTPDALAIFAAHHVFAVWDFMSLLKRLQQQLTCVAVPWLPPQYPAASRLINEIVLGEESDETPCGFCSHFELYRKAMAEIGASGRWIDCLLARLRAGHNVRSALDASGAPASVSQFVDSTFSVLSTGSIHEIAAVFTLTREDLVPQMFLRVITECAMSRKRYPLFFYYLDRHIEVDSTSHGPLAQSLLSELCNDDTERVRQANAAACRALYSRIALWDGILQTIRNS